MSERVNWGILGTGRIAGVFAKGLTVSQTGTLVAVGSRTQEAAEAFGARWGVAEGRRYGSYEALLADPEVQAVYISTPHPAHAEWAIKAAEAGKHILCEKPLTLNHADAMTVIEAAQRADVFLMEAFMYRGHPQIALLRRLLREGAIGEVRLIQATFAFRAGDDPKSRLLDTALGGGGILDVGGYCASLARLVAGAAVGKDFADPLQVQAAGHVGATGADEYTAATLTFPGDVVAQLFTAVRVNGENVARIFGTEGSITLPAPWTPGPGEGRLIVARDGEGQPQEYTFAESGDLYAQEADTVAAHLAERQSPTMRWDDTLGNMRTLDLWREALGVVYADERPTGRTTPAHGRPLARRGDTIMRYGTVAGVEKPISRLVLGVDNQTTWPHAAAMFDDFFERGGTCFDTAYIYGGKDGLCERMLGAWVKNRGVREQVVILDKGAHTPFCTPEHLTRQFAESLERLQMDYVDIYMLHRDNLEVPVGEFVEALNAQKAAGRMRAFGGSNWTIARIEEANAYAAAHGLTGFAAMSNNFSLARMVEPVWAGCIAASDAESRAWLTRTQLPLMPWSSQARGFFTGRSHPDDRSDPELANSWYSDDNFQRKARVVEMAQRRGVAPITIALAYVLNQPFPTFPLIGPRAIAETRTSFPALDVTLEPEELRWLNLED